MALGNCVQAYSTLRFTRQVYSGPKGANASPATALSSRTFGTWTLQSAIVRLIAAYHISNPQVYQLAFCSYAIAFAHFMSEWLMFRSTRWGRGLVGPVLVSTASLVWMYLQWDYYVH
jgi:Erg28 like protein